mmetsp:Transcript_40604/g.128051  ORF Transcript_40604/g.128051 Transcript_40604/m.128051 type:complete len:202 (+) Transcript_40604:422-1027(+)
MLNLSHESTAFCQFLNNRMVSDESSVDMKLRETLPLNLAGYPAHQQWVSPDVMRRVFYPMIPQDAYQLPALLRRGLLGGTIDVDHRSLQLAPMTSSQAQGPAASSCEHSSLVETALLAAPASRLSSHANQCQRQRQRKPVHRPRHSHSQGPHTAPTPQPVQLAVQQGLLQGLRDRCRRPRCPLLRSMMHRESLKWREMRFD